MNKRCSACGKEGAPEKKYCSLCGGLLVDPKSPVSSSSPALGSRYGNVSSNQQKKRSSGCVLKIPVLTILLAPIVILVLCLIPPEVRENQAVSFNNSRVIIQRYLAYSKTGSVAISQELINSYLKESLHSAWKPPLAFLPAPEWKSSHVLILPGGVIYSLELAVMGYPLHFSETFRLAGAPQKWVLEPESGSIGRLPVPKYFIDCLSPILSANSPHAEEKLKIVASAKALQLLPGKVVFSGR